MTGLDELFERNRAWATATVADDPDFFTALAAQQSPEYAWKEFQDAGCRDDEIHKITWENACRFYSWDPFAHTPREQASVGALRAATPDVDVTRMSKDAWRARNEAAGIGIVSAV